MLFKKKQVPFCQVRDVRRSKTGARPGHIKSRYGGITGYFLFFIPGPRPGQDRGT